MTLNRNYGKTETIAEYEAISIDLHCNYFNEWEFIVQDVLSDIFKSFNIGSSLEYEEQKKAYREAARFYNSLVPDSECIPLF